MCSSDLGSLESPGLHQLGQPAPGGGIVLDDQHALPDGRLQFNVVHLGTYPIHVILTLSSVSITQFCEKSASGMTLFPGGPYSKPVGSG